METKKVILLAAALAALCLTAPETKAQEYAVTTLSANMMLQAPDFESSLETQCLMGTLVEVLEKNGSWRKVSCPEPYTAWTSELSLKELTPEEAAAWLAADKYVFTPMSGHVLDSPSGKRSHVSDLVAGDLLGITLSSGRPVRRGGYLGVTLPSGQKGWVRKKELEGFGKWAATRKPTAENVIATARLLLGVPYLWGGESSKGVDCSGLVRYCFFLNGLLLPRNTSQQVKLGEEVPILAEDGSLDLSALRPGDLVFFNSPVSGRVNHVSIYLGDGRIIQSSQLVRISTLTDPSSPDYYDRRPSCARRVFGHVGAPGIMRITDSPAYFPQK